MILLSSNNRLFHVILYPKVYACLVPKTVCFFKKYEQMFGSSINILIFAE